MKQDIKESQYRENMIRRLQGLDPIDFDDKANDMLNNIPKVSMEESHIRAIREFTNSKCK